MRSVRPLTGLIRTTVPVSCSWISCRGGSQRSQGMARSCQLICLRRERHFSAIAAEMHLLVHGAAHGMGGLERRRVFSVPHSKRGFFPTHQVFNIASLGTLQFKFAPLVADLLRSSISKYLFCN